ncbi:MAG: NAD(P)-dependent glycerol-3-phosphate dehydrogenase [Oscillospiraceae bacterium]|jgi:glycerol-3-phosphate dehydrogenase (NAD(P)+)|nr:NAD(P)-dependent glycerol-3-phosphate dehydrogenase [Oscillospiraceae bacterium]
MDIAVIGSGAWGTTLAGLLKGNGHKTELLSSRAEFLAKSLPVKARMIVFACASIAFRAAAKLLRGVIQDDVILVNCSKGIEINTGNRLSRVLAEELGAENRIAVLTGPSHAEEVRQELPTGLLAASTDIAAAEKVQSVFMNENFRVYTSTDIVGAELCGALKNVIAIGVGISDGLGYGDNTAAMLMTRGLAEITRLGEKLGGSRDTFSGLAGVGDLIVTCTSKHSRNRRAGINIGRGLTPLSAVSEVSEFVEGFYTAAAVHKLAEIQNVEMPICSAIYSILYEGRNPSETTRELMTRERKNENEPVGS